MSDVSPSASKATPAAETTQEEVDASSDAAPTEREAATRSGDAAPATGKGAPFPRPYRMPARSLIAMALAMGAFASVGPSRPRLPPGPSSEPDDDDLRPTLPRLPPIGRTSGSYVATIWRPGEEERIEAARAKRERKAAKRRADAAKREAGRG